MMAVLEQDQPAAFWKGLTKNVVRRTLKSGLATPFSPLLFSEPSNPPPRFKGFSIPALIQGRSLLLGTRFRRDGKSRSPRILCVSRLNADARFPIRHGLNRVRAVSPARESGVVPRCRPVSDGRAEWRTVDVAAHWTDRGLTDWGVNPHAPPTATAGRHSAENGTFGVKNV